MNDKTTSEYQKPETMKTKNGGDSKHEVDQIISNESSQNSNKKSNLTNRLNKAGNYLLIAAAVVAFVFPPAGFALMGLGIAAKVGSVVSNIILDNKRDGSQNFRAAFMKGMKNRFQKKTNLEKEIPSVSKNKEKTFQKAPEKTKNGPSVNTKAPEKNMNGPSFNTKAPSLNTNKFMNMNLQQMQKAMTQINTKLKEVHSTIEVNKNEIARYQNMMDKTNNPARKQKMQEALGRLKENAKTYHKQMQGLLKAKQGISAVAKEKGFTKQKEPTHQPQSQQGQKTQNMSSNIGDRTEAIKNSGLPLSQRRSMNPKENKLARAPDAKMTNTKMMSAPSKTLSKSSPTLSMAK